MTTMLDNLGSRIGFALFGAGSASMVVFALIGAIVAGSDGAIAGIFTGLIVFLVGFVVLMVSEVIDFCING